MKTPLYMCLIGLVALLSACSPYSLVNSETYNDADLSQYKTFRIVTPDMGSMPPGMELVTYYNIAAAIREQMVMRGFKELETSPLLINIAVTTKREIQTEPLMPPGYFPYHGPYYPSYMWPRHFYGPYWNPAYYQNAQVITGIYREGVLTMDMVNIESKLPLFSASVSTIINGGGNGYQNLSGIQQAVATLFSKFPVAVLPQYKTNK